MIFKELKDKKFETIILVFFMTIVNGLSLVSKYINKITFDQVFYNKNIDFLFDQMIYLIVGVVLLMLIMGLVNQYWCMKLYSKINVGLKSKFYSEIINSDYLFLNNQKAGNIYYRMFSDLEFVYKYVLDIVLNVPIKIIYLVCCSCMMVMWSVQLTLVYFALLAAKVIYIILSKKNVDQLTTKYRNSEQNIVSYLYEDFSKIRAIKCNAIEDWKVSTTRLALNDYSNVQIKTKFFLALFEIVNHFIENLWSIVYVIVGALLVYNNQITIGALVGFTSVTASVSAIAYSILDMFYVYPQAKVSYNRYLEYTKKKNKFENSGENNFLLDTEMSVNKLSYQYPDGERKIIDELSFVVRPGTIVKINGENGSGKSTLLNYLARWIAYEKGDVKLDNINIFDIKGGEYKRNIGYVYPNVELFNLTYYENVVLGRDSVDQQFVEHLIDELNIRSMIEKMPDGMDTFIGKNGYQLSDGNIQKVGILRAFCHKPKIILLDEPTENLDLISKQRFAQFIKDYVKENQAIVYLVSHDSIFDSIAHEEIYL